MARLDHVVIAVRDLEEASSLLSARLGLSAYAGGRITGIGTESFIVPVGNGYLELIGICEEREAVANPLGRAVQAALVDCEASFLTWAVEPAESVQPTAARLSLVANPMKRALPDGGYVTCTVVGLQQALDEPPLPYFVEWQSKEDRPDQVDVQHDLEPTGFAWIEIAGDQKRLKEWVGDSSVPLQYADTGNGVQAVSIVTDGEPLVLRAPLDFAALPSVRGAAAAAAEGEEQVAVRADDGTPSDRGLQPSVLDSVLDRVEGAMESAATVLESVAEQIVPPPLPSPTKGD